MYPAQMLSAMGTLYKMNATVNITSTTANGATSMAYTLTATVRCRKRDMLRSQYAQAALARQPHMPLSAQVKHKPSTVHQPHRRHVS